MTFVRLILHVVLPIFVGTCIYIGWHSPSLLVFRWIEFSGLEPFIIRPSVELPNWMLYSLPDGCWVYAATSLMLLVWNRFVPWVWLSVVLAVASEVGQATGYVTGTFDWRDIYFYVGSFLIAGELHAQTRSINCGDALHDRSRAW